MTDYHDLISCYGGDDRELMATFIDRLKGEQDRRSYAEALRLFNEITGDSPLRATEEVFGKYVRALGSRVEKGAWKHSTALKNRKIVASFIRYCGRLKDEGSAKVPADFEDRLMYSPMKKLDESFHADRIVSMGDIDRLYCHLRDSGRYQLMCAFIFSFRCFLRPVNFVRATFSDIYRDASGECFLRAAGRSAMVHVPSDCVPYIEACREASGGDYIFGKSRKNEPMEVTYLDRLLKGACADAGIGAAGVTFNELRNSATVYAVTNGATPEMMAEARDQKTLSHFTKLSSLTMHYDDSADSYLGIRFKPREE